MLLISMAGVSSCLQQQTANPGQGPGYQGSVGRDCLEAETPFALAGPHLSPPIDAPSIW